MLQQIFNQYIFLYVMVGIFILGVCTRLIVDNSFRSLLKSSRHMELGKNKVLRTMEDTFLNCYQLQVGVHNVDSFVDKHVYSLKKCGISLYTWESICGQLYLYTGLVTVVSVVLGIINECEINKILYHGMAGVVMVLMLIIMEKAANLTEKRNMFKANVKDYFENYLAVVCEGKQVNEDILEEYQAVYLNKKEAAPVEKVKKNKKLKSKKVLKREEMERIKMELAKELKEERKRAQSKYQKELSLKEEKTVEEEKTVKEQEDAGMQELIESLKILEQGRQANLAATESVEDSKEAENKKSVNTKPVKTLQLSESQEKLVRDILKEYLA